MVGENNRVQIFSLEGDFISSWFSHRACGVCVHQGLIYIAELGTHSAVHGYGQWSDYRYASLFATHPLTAYVQHDLHVFYG